ncbi:YafY family protein [Roseibium porphyridii]|uniref:YafY family protein n=1 Tax=Roseibium porphyridii TaxID=2866279 RepID=A0ABY8F569_9HYPH|nr:MULTISPECIES: YafY family protein [Stappiaceae]QFT33141.1 HTH domain protein [Labrenzia sp. THAF82]WFE88430.1 YafY family protein [Roseibium sp. KMA01]
MRRADRLFQIVQYLRGGRLVRARQLSEWLEVSERTIYRDVADLQASGVPIEGAAGVGYIMRDGYELPPLMFTRDEIVALLAGARLIRAWGGAAMARAAEEAMIKIDAVMPDKLRVRQNEVQIHAFAPEMTPQVRSHIDFLENAADTRKRLSIAYRDGKGDASDRVIRPLGLWFWGKVWTLVAWCELRHDFRMFRLDRISELRETGEKFKAEPGKTLKDFYRSMESKDPGR